MNKIIGIEKLPRQPLIQIFEVFCSEDLRTFNNKYPFITSKLSFPHKRKYNVLPTVPKNKHQQQFPSKYQANKQDNVNICEYTYTYL